MTSVFVLMPFEDAFNSVYSGFLEKVLKGRKFDVIRADNIENQRSIMRDVIEGIVNCDLIVADLTGSNPNVYYELGIAHALGKPVIHLTQDLEEVPFDLQSYRLIEYSTHFEEIEKAMRQLDSYASRFLEGKLQVGNPVTDFRPDNPVVRPFTEKVPAGTGVGASTDNVLEGTGVGPSSENLPDGAGVGPSTDNVSDDAEERGFLDHLVAVTEGYEHFAQITERVTSELEGMSDSVAKTSEDIRRVTANPNQSSPSAVRGICRRLAERIGAFNLILKPANTEYEKIAQETEDSLEFVLSFQLEQSDVMNPEVAEQIESQKQLLASITDTRDACLEVAISMDDLPRLERRLNRELDRGSAEITSLARNLDRIAASISRALNKYDLPNAA